MGDTGRFAIYSRKSRFTGKGESIENQIEMCRQYLTLHYGEGFARDALVYEDEGFSGGTLERPCFKKMMEAANRGEFTAIVVYRLDRISRNIGDFAKLIEQLNGLGIGFISIKEQFDTSSPMGRAMMYISSVFSQLERETIAERIRDNMHELSKTGRWLGGVTPTGYCSESVTRVNVDGKVKKACKLKAIQEEIKVVKLIYDKFIETNSLTKTETYLLNNGYLSKNGKTYTRFSIRAILTNPVYMIADNEAWRYFTSRGADVCAREDEFDGLHGIMAYNRTLQKTGHANQIKPIEEWIVAVGQHEGIITGETWVKVQANLDVNRSKSYRKPRSHVALLSGLLVCGNCGEFMRPKLTGRLNADDEYIYMYRCSMKERSLRHKCMIRDCNGNILDKQVIDQIKALSEDGSEFIRRLEKSKKDLTSKGDDYNKEIAQLEKSLADNEKEIKGLVAAVGKAGETAAGYLFERIEELHGKNVKTRERLESLRELMAASNLSETEFDLLADMLRTFGGTVDSMTVEEKRAAIRAFVKKIIWDGENAHIVFFGSDYSYEFPDIPVGLDTVEDGENVNFNEEVERWNVKPLGEDSKRDTHVFPLSAQERRGCVAVGYD